MLTFFLCAVALLGVGFARWWARATTKPLTERQRTSTLTQLRRGFAPPKPPWVRKEVIRLKALMPEYGCRKIAVTFNHLHGETRRMTVGKSFVANALRNAQAEILEARRTIRKRRPRPMPRNRLWAMDLTFVDRRPVLGIIDHGTRACVALRELPTKASIEILRALLDAIERYGKPRTLRTDNEPVFTSKLFRGALWLLGIRAQRTAPFAPWQNGRIERFFGTFKKALTRLTDGASLDLRTFRAWYNHVRPHENLDGQTPAAVWSRGQRPRKRRRPRYVHLWEGALTGFYFE